MSDALSHSEFRAGFEALLKRGPSELLNARHFVEIPCDLKPWLDSGIDLEQGEAVTTFAWGRTELKGTGLWFGAGFQLWFRIGEGGEIFRGTRAGNSFTADTAGRLYLASYFPGEWASRTGELATPDEVYALAAGRLTVLILRWPGAPLANLRRLAALGDVGGLVAAEIDRLAHPPVEPAGWKHLWFVGPSEIYRDCLTPDRQPAICCHTHRDVGLLQREVDLPLTPATRLRWQWRLDRLPSAVREDRLESHDYLSIAVEFDNGQDITYYWSAELPVGTGYRCPIPTWTARETHVVIRSGSAGLGEWLSEERDLYRDYQDYIGGPLPARIVKVWLIAVSLFQGHEGDGSYAGIEFVTDEKRVAVAMG
ncbi:MAG: DUF3047 domain-containing protein [Methylococcaceae bacterium]|nr:DUF3047 domain-containing protein [Methylococcaceae bacterium]